MKKKIKIGIVGCGGIANAHAGALEKLPEHFELAAVCDAHRPSAERMAQRFGLPEGRVFDDVEKFAASPVEAAIVATPHHQHAPLTAALLRAGKHVLVEKPFALTREEAAPLAALAAEKKRVLAVGHCQRHGPEGLALRQIIQDGWLGQVFGAQATAVQYLPMYVKPESNHWLYSSRLAGGGIVISVAVHKLDLLRFLLGEVETASALFETDPARGTPRRAFEWTAGVNLKFASGAIATLFACYKGYSDKWEPETLSLFGSEGTIRCGGGDAFEVISRKAPAWANSFISHRPPGNSAWIGQLEAFHASIAEGAPNSAGAADALKTMALIDAIYESGAQGGAPVRPRA